MVVAKQEGGNSQNGERDCSVPRGPRHDASASGGRCFRSGAVLLACVGERRRLQGGQPLFDRHGPCFFISASADLIQFFAATSLFFYRRVEANPKFCLLLVVVLHYYGNDIMPFHFALDDDLVRSGDVTTSSSTLAKSETVHSDVGMP